MLFCESLVSFMLSDFLGICVYLLNKRVIVELFGFDQFAVHDTTLGKLRTDIHGVNIVQTVVFLLGIKPVLLDELCHSALYLRPRHFIIKVRSCHGDVQGLRYVAAVFLGEPSGCVTLTGVVCHIPDDSLLAFNVAVPSLQSFINFSLRDFTGDNGCFNCRRWGLIWGFCNAYRLDFGFLG